MEIMRELNADGTYEGFCQSNPVCNAPDSWRINCNNS